MVVATYARIGYHNTLVAIANKHARLVWALLIKDQPLRGARDRGMKQTSVHCEQS